MKASKIFRLALICAFFSLYRLNAQQINSSGYYPATPTSSDSITYYNYMLFYLDPCTMDSSSVRDSLNYIILDAYHCLGTNSSVCLTNDTIRIAPHPAGNYYIVYRGHYDTIPCGTGYTGLTGTGFAVEVFTTGIQITDACRLNVIYDSQSSSLNFLKDKSCRTSMVSLKIYDVRGTCVFRKNDFDPAESVKWNATAGYYFFELEDREGLIRKGKFLVSPE